MKAKCVYYKVFGLTVFMRMVTEIDAAGSVDTFYLFGWIAIWKAVSLTYIE